MESHAIENKSCRFSNLKSLCKKLLTGTMIILTVGVIAYYALLALMIIM